MKAKVRFTDVDRGYKKRVKLIRTMGDPEVTIGIHEAEGGAQNGSATVLDIGIWNEFGTSRIPPRSFIRAWFDENKEPIETMWKSAMRAVAKGKISKKDALDQFGLWCVGQIQARMAAGVPPPNAPSTIARKGSSTPLIDTGVLRSSITHKVVLK